MLPLVGAAVAFNDAKLFLIRHGRTEMNEHLAQPGNQWGAANFADPGYYDTELTSVGQQQARELHEQFRKGQFPLVDTLISSPLRRALHTAELVFTGYIATGIAQRIVTPLAAERLFLSSDVGSPIAELRGRFDPAWSFDSLSEPWWYQGDPGAAEWRPPGTYCAPGEPDLAFSERMQLLVAFLQGVEPRPAAGKEGSIALVCHAEVIYALTGKYVSNCACIEMHTTDLDAGRVTRYIVEHKS